MTLSELLRIRDQLPLLNYLKVQPKTESFVRRPLEWSALPREGCFSCRLQSLVLIFYCQTAAAVQPLLNALSSAHAHSSLVVNVSAVHSSSTIWVQLISLEHLDLLD